MSADRIVTGDTFDVLPTLGAESVHAVVTDPPYGLAFMGRDWDDFEPKEYQEWCEEWAREVRRVLKPGGHLLAFSGNRTHHRLFTGVEDAGFEIRDTLTWHYGSGFPKASDISKTIDKRGGAPPELTDEISTALKKARKSRGISITDADERFCDGTTYYSWFEGRPAGTRLPPDEIFADIAGEWPELKEYEQKVQQADRDVIETRTDEGDRTVEILSGDGKYEVTAPATDAAKKWDGWKTGLKPATEYIVMARKPFDGATVDCVLEHGTGALNIDETRIGTDERTNPPTSHNDNCYADAGDRAEETVEGRYPSNVIFDEIAAEQLDQEVETATGGRGHQYKQGEEIDNDIYGDGYKRSGQYYEDQDHKGPSRYFYTSKASKSERTENGQIANDHPTVKPGDLMEWLIRLVTREGQTVLDPFVGSGTTCKAAKALGRQFLGIERQAKYADIARVRCGLTPDDPATVREDDAQRGFEAYTDGGASK